MAPPPALSSIIAWLRAGYPDGVPEQDYLPLFALLASRLSDDEVSAIAAELAESSDPATGEAIRAAIRQVTDHEPNAADVARVSAHLSDGGWPPGSP